MHQAPHQPRQELDQHDHEAERDVPPPHRIRPDVRPDPGSGTQVVLRARRLFVAETHGGRWAGREGPDRRIGTRRRRTLAIHSYRTTGQRIDDWNAPARTRTKYTPEGGIV